MMNEIIGNDDLCTDQAAISCSTSIQHRIYTFMLHEGQSHKHSPNDAATLECLNSTASSHLGSLWPNGMWSAQYFDSGR